MYRDERTDMTTQPLPSLKLQRRIFLRSCCAPSPPVAKELRDHYDASQPPAVEDGPLRRTRWVYGNAPSLFAVCVRSFTPIHLLPPLLVRPFRDWTTADTSTVCRKPVA